MTFYDAVKKYYADMTDETLYEAASELCRELKLSEKLHMLSGQRFFMRNGFDLITKGQKYNCRPCLSGGVKRLGIPAVAFWTDRAASLWETVPAFPFPWLAAQRLTRNLNTR